MALNQFFLNGSINEQFLIQDLINEQLKIYGIEVYYLPRKIIKSDDIIKEVQSSQFDDSFLIEAYLNNYEGYAPGFDIMTKFGISLKNEIILTISKERFEEFISPFLVEISSEFEENLTTRPKEGDLIYFPLGERLFEIKRVESEKPFYQLGKNYVYELNCELYEYENEVIDTSVKELDNVVSDKGYITKITLIGSSLDAVAIAGISSSYVREIFLNNDGSGYTSVPDVIISPPEYGTRATAVAITTDFFGTKSIKSIQLINAGSGYLSNPTISIIGGGGAGAAATCSIASTTTFGVTLINLQGRGKGYTSPPKISISPPTGIGETATAVSLIENNEVSEIRIINPGSGYTETPTVEFTTNPNIGVGTYLYNEIVTGSISGTTARVKKFTKKIVQNNLLIDLEVSVNNGSFYNGEVLVGSISSSRYIIQEYDRDSYENEYDSNKNIEEEADSILNFSEYNPFGEY